MSHSEPALRALDRPIRAWRIGDASGRYPVFSAEGARRAAGRWNEAGDAVIYASECYATALLEKLVRLGELPPNQHAVEITIPAGTSYEVVTADVVPAWAEKNGAAARAFGHAWFGARRSSILLMPSVVARVERNVLINAAHPEFPRIQAGLETPVVWDGRLFD